LSEATLKLNKRRWISVRRPTQRSDAARLIGNVTFCVAQHSDARTEQVTQLHRRQELGGNPVHDPFEFPLF
jgi:hypothetical protein